MGSKPHQHNFPIVQSSLDQHRASWMTPSGNAVERMSALGGGGRHDLPTSRPAPGFPAPGWSQGRKGVGGGGSEFAEEDGGGCVLQRRPAKARVLASTLSLDVPHTPSPRSYPFQHSQTEVILILVPFLPLQKPPATMSDEEV